MKLQNLFFTVLILLCSVFSFGMKDSVDTVLARISDNIEHLQKKQEERCKQLENLKDNFESERKTYVVTMHKLNKTYQENIKKYNHKNDRDVWLEIAQNFCDMSKIDEAFLVSRKSFFDTKEKIEKKIEKAAGQERLEKELQRRNKKKKQRLECLRKSQKKK